MSNRKLKAAVITAEIVLALVAIFLLITTYPLQGILLIAVLGVCIVIYALYKCIYLSLED
jgi:hypothetical protein